MPKPIRTQFTAESPEAGASAPLLARELRGNFFTRLQVEGTSFAAIFDFYREWLLGVGRFQFHRRRRLDVGVNSAWTLDRFSLPGDWDGLHGLKIRIRRSPGEAIIHLFHLDSQGVRRTWTNQARILDGAGCVIIEHGARCTEPSRERRPGAVEMPNLPEPPAVLTALLRDTALKVGPGEFASAAPRLLEAGQVRSFVLDHLLSEHREAPCTILTGHEPSGGPLVVPDELARRLSTVSSLYVLPDRSCTDNFRKAIESRGLPVDLQCFGGGIRVFLPGMHAFRASSREEWGWKNHLWIAAALLDVPEGSRAAWIAGQIINWVERRVAPEQFWASVARFDQELSARRHAEFAAQIEEGRRAGQLTLGEVTQLRDRNQELHAENTLLLEECRKAEANAAQYERAWQESEMNLEEEKARSFHLKQQQTSLDFHAQKQKRKALDSLGESFLQDFRGPILAVLGGAPSPEESMRALSFLFRDRIEVFDSAYKSARKSEALLKEYRSELWKLCLSLAGPYWEALSAGKPDSVAREAFSKGSYAAHESETTSGSKRAMKERRFPDASGREYLMAKHLKVGRPGKDSVAHVLRLHFEWDATRKLLLIGWCGEHRGLS